MVTDTDFLERVLSDGEWHSRAADLRKKGHTVEVDVRGGARRASFYRMVALNAAPALSAAPPSAADNGDDPTVSPQVGAALSASIPADAAAHGLESHDRGGALTLFDQQRGAYAD